MDSRLISLSSSQGVSINGSFLSNIEYPIIIKEPNVEKIFISLLDAQIPVSFYIINYTNNKFKMKLDTGPVIEYTVTVGNYNGNSLINELTTLINDTNFIITLNKITGKLNFSHNKSFIIYNNFQYSIGSVLGFEKDSINNSVLNTITPSYPLNLLGIQKLFIMSQELQSYNITPNNGCIIATIPKSATPYGLIDYHNMSNTTHILRRNDIDKIDIHFLDEQNNYINFNNCNWNITLKIDILYKNNIEIKIPQPKEKPLENIKKPLTNDDLLFNK